MAETIEAFDFERGRRAKYPWKEWTDGQIWKVEQGVDFHCSPESLRYSVHGRARVLGRKAHTAVVDDKHVVFQFLGSKT